MMTGGLMQSAKADAFDELAVVKDVVVNSVPLDCGHAVFQPELEAGIHCIHEFAAEFCVGTDLGLE
jgi:hypothetical protein